ncbi:hypothetical protein [Fibrivirga algicola]|uniref:Lipoprotein n=1 Tax=Fibrivirga algicola TaxID=2950420 RepID=A0ABX0QNT8_9BACT|nr:hypothetical protein [Fibrivirga algicola]NID12936.1 hypothetical protein [Fibrivirga algicola]
MKSLGILAVVSLLVCCQPEESASSTRYIEDAIKAVLDQHDELDNECIFSDTLFVCSCINEPLSFVGKNGTKINIQPDKKHLPSPYSHITDYSIKNDTIQLTVLKESCGVVATVRLVKSSGNEWVVVAHQEADI